MTERSLYRSGIGVEVNGTSGDAEEKMRPVSIGSPSSSSSSSSSLSWSKKQNNASYGISSESETSLEYPDTPVTEEFKETTPRSQKLQAAEESGLSASLSDSVSLDASISSGSPFVSAIQRRSGYYGRRTKEDRARIRAEKIASGMANQSLPSLPLVVAASSSSSAAIPVAVVAMSYLDKVVQETVDTEKLYVKDLKDIIRGYLLPLAKSKDMQVPREDLHALFGNIKAIYKFNRKFVDRLKKSNLDPVQIGKCFVDESDGFKVYADYCTNYPRSLETLSRYCLDPRFAFLMKRFQELLNHPLPLQTYLFKPIQRILKYHLLLKNIVSHHNESLPGHEILVQAHTSMMDVANHLNDVKRNQERRIEIQRLLIGSNGMDLSSFGELILEDKFNSGLRDVHFAFLFRKGLLIAKKRRDDQLQLKTTIMCSNLMLVESIPREPLAFHVLPFDSPKTQFTLQARNLDQKQRWCREIKTLMLDSYNVAIPDKARQLLMRTGNGPKEQDRHFEIPKRHVAPEYLERRRLRRQSISSITGSNTRSLVESTIARTLEVTGRSSENLLLIKTEDTRSRGSRSRPLRVDSGRHQTSERRSQSLDSLRNVEQDGVMIHPAVKSEQRNKVERGGEERGSKSEHVEKQKRAEEKRSRESVKPPEDMEIRKERSGSREEKPLDLRKGKENCLEDVVGPESGLRCLEENWYSNEYREELAKTLVYEEKRENERINTKDCEDEQRISVNVYKDEMKNERIGSKDFKDDQKTSVNVYKDEKKNKRTSVKDCEDEQRSQTISVLVYKDDKKHERRNTKQYEDELQVSMTVYDDEKKSEKINVKESKDTQRINKNVDEVKKRNESESNEDEAESREESGEEEVTAPAAEEEEEEEDVGAANTLTVSRNAALRANSFRRAVDLNRVDSKAVKKSQVQVRRKISEDQNESDEEAEEEEDSSESNDEAVLSNYQPKLLPISGDNSVDNDSEEQSPLRFGQAAPYIAEKWSEICSAFGLVDGNRSGACDDSRHSSVSFLSTTFESLAADELLTDVTQEDFFVTEEFFDSNKLEEVENGETKKKVISGGSSLDDARQNVEDSSQEVESAQNVDSFEQLNITDMSVEFLRQISSTPSKADISIEVDVVNPYRNPDDGGNAAYTNTENSDALRDILKEIEQYFPTDGGASHSNCNATESNIPDHVISEHAVHPVLTVSHSVKSPTLRPGRHSYVMLERRGSAGDCLKGTLVQNSSSLPSLSDHITSETSGSGTHGSVTQQAGSDRPSLVHSRKLSASDMTGYFSAGKAPAAGDFPSMPDPSSSAGLSSKGHDRSRTSSGTSDAGETEKQDATGMFEGSFEVGRLSELSDTRDVQMGISPGAGSDAVDSKPLLAPKPVDKQKKRGKLLFEKVSSPNNVPGVGAASQRQNPRTERKRHDETKSETSNEIAAKSKRHQKNSEGNDCPTGLYPIRSPSAGPFEDIPYREVARRFDRQHTYVYRLARAYSSRVKQLQNEAALYQHTVKSGTRRTLRKWSTLDESSSRHERKSSQSESLRRDSSTPQNRDTVSLAENDLELSTSGRSAFSVSSSPFLSLKNSKSVIDSWRPISESRAKARKSSKKPAKPFGLSFDGLPDFCFSGGGNGESDSEDCFDDEQDTSAATNLVKSRVRHFESHKESNC